MKRLLVCLLLVGVVGCGSSQDPEQALVQDESPEPPPVETDANKAEAEYNKGVDFALYRENWDAAIACYTEAIRIKPDYAMAYINRGVAYAGKGQYDKAITDYTEAIRIDPDDAKACVNRGVVYGNKGQYDKAIADFTEAIRINPDYTDAYNGRGVAYRKLGNDVKAAADFAKAKELGVGP